MICVTLVNPLIWHTREHSEDIPLTLLMKLKMDLSIHTDVFITHNMKISAQKCCHKVINIMLQIFSREATMKNHMIHCVQFFWYKEHVCAAFFHNSQFCMVCYQFFSTYLNLKKLIRVGYSMHLLIVVSLTLSPTTCLTLILLTWNIWWAPTNASKWQMALNSVFKGLIYCNVAVYN
jgi:hypothetical protein